MRYSIKNNTLIPFKSKFFVYNGRVYVNPTDEQLEMAGYLLKAEDYDDAPEDKDGFYYVIKPYKGEDNRWYKMAEYYEIPDEANESTEE